MIRSSKLFLLASVVALGFASAASQAAVVFSTQSLAGTVVASGFNDLDNVFKVSFSGLTGTVNAQALPDGKYSVSGQGQATFTDTPGSGFTQSFTVDNPLAIFSGFLSSDQLTVGSYPLTFGGTTSTIPTGSSAGFGFSIGYNGYTSTQFLNGLNAFFAGLPGFVPFVDPTGSGILGVSGTLFSDGADFTFTESALDWTGFGGLLNYADQKYGGSNGRIDGTFALTDVTVTAVPEPAPVALIGLALTGLAVLRRRKF